MPSFLDVYLFLTGLTGITKTIITSILNGDWCIIPVYFDSRYIVGEVRSAEAIDMLQALNTGHLVRASYQQSYQCSAMIIKNIMSIGVPVVQVVL